MTLVGTAAAHPRAVDAAVARLHRLHPKLIDLSLGRMERLLAALDHPEQRLPPVVHVAGTNGKGSTIAFMRAILRAAGYHVHVYTSPHLVRFNERIELDGEAISDDVLHALIDRVEAANGEAPITFFEVTTAVAFLAFAEHPADILLLEVGLGGRLDATNVVEAPAVSVITAIGLDHQDFLGETIAKIAVEKAGIIKPGRPVVIGPQNEAEALPVLTRQAAALGAPVTHADAGDVPAPPLGLKGPGQRENAATALAALGLLEGMALPQQAIQEGLAAARWPARMQPITQGPLAARVAPAELWLDGGHNPHAAAFIAPQLALWAQEGPVTLIFGMMRRKDPAAFLAALAAHAGQCVTLTAPAEAGGSWTAEELAEAARVAGLTARPAASLDEALDLAASSAGRGMPRILIAGSLYLAGEVLARTGP